MSGICTCPGAPMEAINLFSLSVFSSCSETLGILDASHWQLPNLTRSLDILTSLLPVCVAKIQSLYWLSSSCWLC